MVYVQKVNRREKLQQRTVSAARNINSAAVLREVTSCVVRKGIQADGGHFEHLI